MDIPKYVHNIPKNKIDHKLNVLNSFNKHIQFTFELKNDGKLPYDDKNQAGFIDIEWYQKEIISYKKLNYTFIQLSSAKFHSVKIKNILLINRKAFHIILFAIM